jgi:NADH:ubiquinone oxidoreductase subunit F (NADH-binding)
MPDRYTSMWHGRSQRPGLAKNLNEGEPKTMKHLQVMTKAPHQAGASTVEILTIVATALSALATVLTTVLPLIGGKR